jgi:hypothetical protein
MLSAAFPLPTGLIALLISLLPLSVDGYICTHALPEAHLAPEKPAEMLLPVEHTAVPV